MFGYITRFGHAQKQTCVIVLDFFPIETDYLGHKISDESAVLAQMVAYLPLVQQIGGFDIWQDKKF